MNQRLQQLIQRHRPDGMATAGHLVQPRPRARFEEPGMAQAGFPMSPEETTADPAAPVASPHGDAGARPSAAMATGSLIPETPSALLQPAPDTQTTGQPVEHPIGPQTIPPRREEAQAATAPLHPQEPEPRPENEAPHSPIAGNSATLRTQRILDALAPHATPQPPDTGPAASMTMPSTPPGHRPSRGEPTGEIPSSDQTPTRGKTDRRVMPAPVSRETSAGITDHLDANLRPAQDPALGLPLPESGNATLLAPAWLAELSKLQSSLQTHGPEPTTPPREEPVVNVTIGRIEIKASPEPPASAPRKENKPRGVMTLQDYLQQRNEARS